MGLEWILNWILVNPYFDLSSRLPILVCISILRGVALNMVKFVSNQMSGTKVDL